MTWRFILKQLGMPPGSLLLLLLMAWLLRKRMPKTATGLFFITLAALYGLSMPLVTQQLASHLENQPALTQDRWPQLADHASAIIILGGGREPADPAWAADQPSLFAVQRLRYGARLARASSLPVLVTGGLHFDRPPSEARIMADTLQQDFSVAARWLEERSRTTWENARFSAEILQPEGIATVVLVTDAWHMRRARWSFEQAGFQVIPAPQGFYSANPDKPLGGWLPESRAFWQNTQLLNELLGLWLYPVLYAR